MDVRPDRSVNLISYSELLERPAPTWRVHQTLPSRGFTMLVGQYSSGKTFVALDLALCVACNQPFAGRSTRGGGVVYVAAEGSYRFAHRIRAWLIDREDRCRALIDERFRIVEVPVQLAQEAALGQFVMAIRSAGLQPALVIVDTQSRCTVGLDENDSSEMGTFVAGADSLVREFDCTVLVVHHTGKDGETERGSSAVPAAAETVLWVEKTSERSPTVTLYSEKQKDGPEGNRVEFDLETVLVGRDDDGAPITSCRLRLKVSADGPSGSPSITRLETDLGRNGLIICRTLRDHFLEDGACNRALLTKSRVPKGSFNRDLKNAVSKGYVVRGGTEHRPRYTLTAKFDEPMVSTVSDGLTAVDTKSVNGLASLPSLKDGTTHTNRDPAANAVANGDAA